MVLLTGGISESKPVSGDLLLWLCPFVGDDVVDDVDDVVDDVVVVVVAVFVDAVTSPL